MSKATLIVRVLAVLVIRPRLWATAFGLVRSHSISRRGTKVGLLPRPARPYLEFRLETQYGSPRLTAVDSADVLKYVEWVKDWNSRT